MRRLCLGLENSNNPLEIVERVGNSAVEKFMISREVRNVYLRYQTDIKSLFSLFRLFSAGEEEEAGKSFTIKVINDSHN